MRLVYRKKGCYGALFYWDFLSTTVLSLTPSGSVPRAEQNRIKIAIDPDGTVWQTTIVDQARSDPLFRAVAESALRQFVVEGLNDASSCSRPSGRQEGGRLVIYDVFSGNSGSLMFAVPLARRPSARTVAGIGTLTSAPDAI